VVVRALTDTHLPKQEARLLYDDVTPPPTAEELEMRRLAALARPHRAAMHPPDKRERRALRRIKVLGAED
jgi:hypothetical protein